MQMVKHVGCKNYTRNVGGSNPSRRSTWHSTRNGYHIVMNETKQINRAELEKQIAVGLTMLDDDILAEAAEQILCVFCTSIGDDEFDIEER